MELLDRKQLRPIEYPGLVRLGVAGDGGYVVPSDQVQATTTLLSLGIDEDWSFDRAFIAANPAARVIGVDHSVGPAWFKQRLRDSLADLLTGTLRGERRQARRHWRALKNAVDYFVFFRPPHRHIQKRVAATDDDANISLPSLLRVAGDPAAHSVFLKVDIEGWEYQITAPLVDGADAINCVVIEFHRLGTRTAEFNRAIAHLLTRFRIVHVHGNNYSNYDTRIDFPDAVEITLLHHLLVPADAARSAHAYPRPGLDVANLPRRPDHPLRFD